jgi:hypothetical protein
MMILRFFAGPIVHSLSPLGLLAVSSVLAVAGLFMLSTAAGTMIFVAATLYGIGKTFFWPTMLGVVSEQMPKGGALTLNAISGIGMLAVGTVGFPFIGTLQSARENQALVADAELNKLVPGIVKDGKITITQDKSIYEVIHYQAIDQEKLKQLVSDLPEAQRETVLARVAQIRGASKQGALADMAMFPAGMLIAYIVLIVYFQTKGGYKPVHMPAADEQPRRLNDDGFGTIKTESGRNITKSDQLRT